MSYSQSFQNSITVSGDVRVSYPASEHGGTVTAHYSEVVPININLHVNTDKFDETVVKTNHCVDGLTGAVAAMDAAQCKVIKDGSKKISESLVNGFYQYINSEMSAQKSENFSMVSSKFALLMEFTKDMISKHERMSSDVERLRGHFGRLFADMDKDLERRIHKLDEPAFHLANQVRTDLIEVPYKVAASFGLEQISENNRSQNLIASARLKKKMSDAMDTISGLVVKNLDYQKAVKQILFQQKCEEPCVEYLPAIVCEKKNLTNDGQISKEVYVAEVNGQEQIIATVQNCYGDNNAGEWKNMSQEDLKLLNQAFNNILENGFTEQQHNDSKNDRVCKEIMRMWNSHQTMLKL
ncbi:MAG: hypothetical protein II312_02720 [Lachnospiraceae bacterium]|nr:hypothetical protein [Lachnospiraceae bacterium]